MPKNSPGQPPTIVLLEKGEIMIKNLSLAILFVMVLFACNDGTEYEDYYSSSHEVPCLDVYESYYNPCAEECAKYCSGWECLYCDANCSYEAKQRAQQCCDRYGMGSEQYEECMWYWSSSMSFSEYVVSMEELKLQEECGCEGEPSPTNP